MKKLRWTRNGRDCAAALYEMGAVCTEEWQSDGSSRLHVRLPLADWRRLNT
jgi:hypothetical protein